MKMADFCGFFIAVELPEGKVEQGKVEHYSHVWREKDGKNGCVFQIAPLPEFRGAMEPVLWIEIPNHMLVKMIGFFMIFSIIYIRVEK